MVFYGWSVTATSLSHFTVGKSPNKEVGVQILLRRTNLAQHQIDFINQYSGSPTFHRGLSVTSVVSLLIVTIASVGLVFRSLNPEVVLPWQSNLIVFCAVLGILGQLVTAFVVLVGAVGVKIAIAADMPEAKIHDLVKTMIPSYNLSIYNIARRILWWIVDVLFIIGMAMAGWPITALFMILIVATAKIGEAMTRNTVLDHVRSLTTESIARLGTTHQTEAILIPPRDTDHDRKTL